MEFLTTLPVFFESHHMPILMLIGIIAVISYQTGRTTRYVKLPSIIGYMIVGVLIGPSFLSIVSDVTAEKLSFLTEMALGFVALSIGLELYLPELKKQGTGIILVILAESFGAFILVTSAVYILTKNIPLAIIFGAIAPASAPAGTVAIIKEYKAKGRLTQALYAVVGFDDGLGIVIFGFASAIAQNILTQETGAGVSDQTMLLLFSPFKEIVLSILIGTAAAFLFHLLKRTLKNQTDYFIHIFGLVLFISGLSEIIHISLILTNMTMGIVLVNTQSRLIIQKIHTELGKVLPLLFVLFFTMAGTSLHINALPSLGILGVIYILSRSAGLMIGSRIGASIGKVHENIKKYVGMGILSQAGVAIGLSLIVKKDFKGVGSLINGSQTSGDYIGMTVITTVTATCIIFEMIGPILTRVALKKAGEIKG